MVEFPPRFRGNHALSADLSDFADYEEIKAVNMNSFVTLKAQITYRWPKFPCLYA
jgi:hypothetical protein